MLSVGNPFVLAAFVAVGIGIAVYQLVSGQKERKHTYGSPRRSQSPPSLPPSPPPSPKKKKLQPGRSGNSITSDTSDRSDPSDNSISYRASTDSIPASRESSVGHTENNVRKRVLETASKLDKEQSRESTPSDVKYRNIDESNYNKYVYDKILNDITGADTKAEGRKNFNKNIPDEDSDSENVSEKDNTELEVGDVLDHSNSSSSNCNDLSQSTETEEIEYKKKVCESLKRESEAAQVVGDPTTSTHDHYYEQNIHIYGNMKQGICSGCEKMPNNAKAYPCGHCYLCRPCSVTVFRLYKKCSICHEEIQKFL